MATTSGLPLPSCPEWTMYIVSDCITCILCTMDFCILYRQSGKKYKFVLVLKVVSAVFVRRCLSYQFGFALWLALCVTKELQVETLYGNCGIAEASLLWTLWHDGITEWMQSSSLACPWSGENLKSIYMTVASASLVKGMNNKDKQHLIYSSILSAIWQVPHSDEIAVPVSTELRDFVEAKRNSSTCDDDKEADAEHKALDLHLSRPSPYSLSESKDLNRDLNLPKQSSELLPFRLQDQNFLKSSKSASLKPSVPKKKQNSLKCSQTLGDLAMTLRASFVTLRAWKWHRELLFTTGLSAYHSRERRMFIDSWKTTFNCVLHNVHIYPYM